MNCSAFEGLIALYVERDLRESERAIVELHLQACAACRDLAHELRESQSIVKNLRQGAVHPAALTEVRQRVLNEVGNLEPAPAWVLVMHRLIFAGLHRKTAIAGVVLVALVSGGVWYTQTRVVSKPGIEAPIEIASVELPSADVPLDVHEPLVVVSRPVAPVEPVEVLPPEEESTTQVIDERAPPEPRVSQIPMKFVTDDPDIIIYWLPSDKGD